MWPISMQTQIVHAKAMATQAAVEVVVRSKHRRRRRAARARTAHGRQAARPAWEQPSVPLASMAPGRDESRSRPSSDWSCSWNELGEHERKESRRAASHCCRSARPTRLASCHLRTPATQPGPGTAGRLSLEESEKMHVELRNSGRARAQRRARQAHGLGAGQRSVAVSRESAAAGGRE
jgi:hypothetical protein